MKNKNLNSENLDIIERRVLVARDFLDSLESIRFYTGPCTKEEKKELRELYDKMMYNAKTAVCKHVIMRNGTCVSWSLNNTRF